MSNPDTSSISGHLARSAGVTGSATFISRILGLVRDQVLAALFGAGNEMDAFIVAFRIPNLVRDLFAEGAMSSAFVPTFTRYLTRFGRDAAWRLGNNVITTLLLVDSHPRIRPSVIAQLIMRDRSAMGRLVDQMIGNELITRQAAPDDGRAQELYITEKGADLARKVRKIATKQSSDFFADVPEKDQKRLLEILRRVYRRTAGLDQ